MLAGQFVARGKVELVEIPEPTLPEQPEKDAGQILFQPELACLCGSDIPFFDSEQEWGDWPLPVGQSLHEMIGTVVKTNGSRFQPGDRVLAVPLEHYGLFERFVLSEDRAILLDSRRPPEEALMAQPLGTVIYALKKVAVLDQDVAVVGQGPMGQLLCATLRKLGARRVIAIDRDAARLEVSPKMGATHVLCNATGSPLDEVKKILGGNLPDLVVEAVGHADQALNLCIELSRKAGTILFFGVPPATVDGIRMRELFFKNLKLLTSVNPDFARDFPLAMQWISEGVIDVRPIITHRFPLAELQTAFETFRDHREGCLKVLVDFPAATT